MKVTLPILALLASTTSAGQVQVKSLSGLSASASPLETSPLTGIQSKFQVKPLTSNPSECGMTSTQYQALKNAKFAKVVCVWGVVIVGTAKYPAANLLYTAQSVQNLLDPSGSGSVWSEAARKGFSAASGQFLGGGVDQNDEVNACDEVQNWDKGCFSLQTWKLSEDFGYMSTTEYHNSVKAIINEEVFHMYSHTLAGIFPQQMGEQDFTSSIACREMAKLQCMKPGWHHEENLCPNGNPDRSGRAPRSPLKGTCSEPNCDCTEFFNQAVLGLIGQTNGWLSPNMPTTQQGFENMLSQEFKDMVRNPRFGLPQKPFNGPVNRNSGVQASVPANNGPSNDSQIVSSSACPCAAGEFANHDDGQSCGWCEPCMSSAQECSYAGLPELGVVACKNQCGFA